MREDPSWLRFLERRIGWIAIPNIAILLVTLQALGFASILANPAFASVLALIPGAVIEGGEYWRLVTFLALPLSTSPLWLFFILWFLYFVLNSLENEWGAFKTTFYVLISVILTGAYALIFDYPVTTAAHFESTLFLAVAALFPETQILLFFAIPAKMKWLAWLSGAFALLEFARGSNLERGYLLAIYSNFLVFFGPIAWSRLQAARRRRRFRQGRGWDRDG